MRNDAYMKPRASISCNCRGLCTCQLKKARARSDTASEVITSFASKYGVIDATNV